MLVEMPLMRAGPDDCPAEGSLIQNTRRKSQMSSTPVGELSALKHPCRGRSASPVLATGRSFSYRGRRGPSTMKAARWHHRERDRR
jgi:hypothetical protein